MLKKKCSVHRPSTRAEDQVSKHVGQHELQLYLSGLSGLMAECVAED
jgi:hypothetical protein